MKDLMSDSDRTELFGVSGSSTPPVTRPRRDSQSELEKQMHIDLENWLSLHELFKVHCRMDMATTTERGIPDFVIGIEGLLVAIEFKRPGNGLTSFQEEHRRKCIGASKCQYHVCYSSKEAIEILQKLLARGTDVQ